MRSTPCVLRLARIAVAALVVAQAPWAQAAPYLSGPSVVFLGETVTLSGGGYAPASFVNIAVAPASGTLTAQAHATDGSGRVEIAIVASVAGLYVVTVTDSGGATLATAQFTVN